MDELAYQLGIRSNPYTSSSMCFVPLDPTALDTARVAGGVLATCRIERPK
jgi:hypothetical protein